MQNREELKKQGHDRRRKMTCCERGKYHFWRINIQTLFSRLQPIDIRRGHGKER
jgi:hypothetical protein